jgi:exopolyphosphatase/guanosine-5'-triphosphate,3'-diphosphate pyrophosphatase
VTSTGRRSTAIIPRWEWRTFGSSFGAADDALAELASSGDPKESDELYLLATDDGNVKVRDGLMDIKVLREVDPAGLERWEPVMKHGFPLAAEDVSFVLQVLRVRQPRLTRSAYDLDQLLDELVRSIGAVREAEIHKRRTRFTLGGCMAELTDVIADGRSTRTVAVESEDAGAVLEAVRSVGLDNYLNVSYRRGLTALLDEVPPRYAVIDVGTNSVKFHVGERGPDGSWRSVVDRAEMTRLGETLQETGGISDAAIERTADAIAGMVDEARRLGVRAIAAVGTAGMRIARNREDVVRAVRARTGVTIEVIPGDEEARLAYRAVRTGLGPIEGSVVVFDTGGGSSQFTFGEGPKVLARFSVDVGAVRATERFGLDRKVVTPDVLQEALAAISEDLSHLDDYPSPDALVGMGGAVTNMTAVMFQLATYDPGQVQGATLDRAEVDRQIELYRSLDADARRAIVGLQPKRAEVILAGACIVRTIMEKLGMGSLTVSDRGVRHGILVDRFGP